MICWTTVRRFDGDVSEALHTAIVPPEMSGLRFIALVTLDKGSGTYAPTPDAPTLTVAWVPRERVTDEASSTEEIDAALADPDQVPLVITGDQPVFYRSDDGSAFPAVGIKGSLMVLAVRLTKIVEGVHGQITLGWEGRSRC
ncbi:hypothetical protein G6O69_37945 [Pseudenhygromyxa sp. WMMC2535]|uniref:hypothetical protein n=1 Tax=Pseudenhygromyxa sp. WMMC2535 TaxID=2712867 RepID=UPI00155656F2|nr:hypothetical protein [Pseudenhygromyxa sp. WMMC2535]NVB38206.1 hypothetical protein [Pseudenhygromyxa sp. WMMC2535]NVB41605.1 hypothetical protein [Pseudenhygromyxa sp. WMMC2535]NVB43629.1 hypothetical protein [Pseudenhygromyxa sp. WMMC2535]NVB43654.1 hypothetical protein [Pseudenhygromyxa sp. WMMC2535]